MATAIVMSASGQHEIDVNEKIYQAAHDAKCSVPQYLQRTYGQGVDAKVHGTVFNQLLAQQNMNLNKDKATGLGSATMRQLLEGGTSAATTRDAIPLSRILLPAAVLELIELNRGYDASSDAAAFNSMLAVDTSVAGNRYEQPVFDASNAAEQEISRIGQLQVPNLVGTLKVADQAGSIPTYSYGLEISDEAVKAMTIDQVAIYLQRMASEQASAQLDNHIFRLVNGNENINQAALPKVKAKTFDAAASGKLTHRAFVKWMRSNRRKRTITHLMGDEETYFKFVERVGRPTANTIRVNDVELAAYESRPMNFNFTEPQFFIVNDGVLPTDLLVGIDSRFAIARVRNSEADYKASEDLIMRRGTAMRFDEGSTMYRLDDTAWSCLDLTA